MDSWDIEDWEAWQRQILIAVTIAGALLGFLLGFIAHGIGGGLAGGLGLSFGLGIIVYYILARVRAITGTILALLIFAGIVFAVLGFFALLGLLWDVGN